jgi:hypothetical protein
MSDLISSLTDEVINETCIKFQRTPPACSEPYESSLFPAGLITIPAWFFELAGGKLPEFESSCVPRSTREAAFTIAALHQWPLEENDPRCIDTAAEVRQFDSFHASIFRTYLSLVDRKYCEQSFGWRASPFRTFSGSTQNVLDSDPLSSSLDENLYGAS